MRIIFFTNLILMLCCSTIIAAPLKVSSIEDLPLNQAVEVIFPDQERRIVASSEQDVVQQGVPKATARRMAEDIAVMRAKATLASFIHGSTFEKTSMVEDRLEVLGSQGKASSTHHSKIVETMRQAALKGVEIIEINRNDSTMIKVVVGVSMRSMQVADNYKDRADSFRPVYSEENGTSSDKASESRQKYWVHPSLR